jgi:hypothetical protein
MRAMREGEPARDEERHHRQSAAAGEPKAIRGHVKEFEERLTYEIRRFQRRRDGRVVVIDWRRTSRMNCYSGAVPSTTDLDSNTFTATLSSVNDSGQPGAKGARFQNRRNHGAALPRLRAPAH